MFVPYKKQDRKKNVALKEKKFFIEQMNRLPTLLKLLISKDSRPASSIAANAGFNPSILSKIAGGAVDPDPQTMVKLLTAFDLVKRRALISAWIEDVAASAGVSEGELRESLGVSGGLYIPEPIRRDLALILAVGGNTREFREAIRALAACLTPAEEFQGVAEDSGPAPVLPPPRPVTYRKSRKS